LLDLYGSYGSTTSLATTVAGGNASSASSSVDIDNIGNIDNKDNIDKIDHMDNNTDNSDKSPSPLYGGKKWARSGPDPSTSNSKDQSPSVITRSIMETNTLLLSPSLKTKMKSPRQNNNNNKRSSSPSPVKVIVPIPAVSPTSNRIRNREMKNIFTETKEEKALDRDRDGYRDGYSDRDFDRDFSDSDSDSSHDNLMSPPKGSDIRSSLGVAGGVQMPSMYELDSPQWSRDFGNPTHIRGSVRRVRIPYRVVH